MEMKKSFAEDLLAIRRRRSPVLPVKEDVARFGDAIMKILFPHFSDEEYFSPEEIEGALRLLKRDLNHVLLPLAGQMPKGVSETAEEFFSKLRHPSCSLAGRGSDQCRRSRGGKRRRSGLRVPGLLRHRHLSRGS
jgi:hypothetical protein